MCAVLRLGGEGIAKRVAMRERKRHRDIESSGEMAEDIAGAGESNGREGKAKQDESYPWGGRGGQRNGLEIW